MDINEFSLLFIEVSIFLKKELDESLFINFQSYPLFPSLGRVISQLKLINIYPFLIKSIQQENIIFIKSISIPFNKIMEENKEKESPLSILIKNENYLMINTLLNSTSNLDEENKINLLSFISQNKVSFGIFNQIISLFSNQSIKSKPIKIIDPSTISNQVKIGEGGFGIVYKAKWDGNEVAIKEMNSRGSSEKSIRNELDKMGQLSHENIVSLFGAINEPFSIVMELIDGSNLKFIFYKLFIFS